MLQRVLETLKAQLGFFGPCPFHPFSLKVVQWGSQFSKVGNKLVVPPNQPQEPLKFQQVLWGWVLTDGSDIVQVNFYSLLGHNMSQKFELCFQEVAFP